MRFKIKIVTKYQQKKLKKELPPFSCKILLFKIRFFNLIHFEIYSIQKTLFLRYQKKLKATRFNIFLVMNIFKCNDLQSIRILLVKGTGTESVCEFLKIRFSKLKRTWLSELKVTKLRNHLKSNLKTYCSVYLGENNNWTHSTR